MGNLKAHKESKHECVRYECDKCDYIMRRKWEILKLTRKVNMNV